MAQAVRDHDGTGDWIDLEVIDITGAFSLVAVVKRDADGAWHAVSTHQTAADAMRLGMALSNANRLQVSTHNGSSAFAEDSSAGSGTPFTVTAADSWCTLVITKSAGGGGTLSKYTPGGGWVHTTFSASVQAPATQAGGKITLGRYQASSDNFNGKIACYAIWNGTQLNQTQVESLDGGDRQAWKSVAGGYTDLIEPAVAPDGTAAASWATNVASENGTLDMTGTAGNGTIVSGDLPSSSVYTLGVTAGNTPPSNTVAPAVTGTPEVGEDLSCSDGTWDGDPAPTFAYQWYSSIDGSVDGYTDFLNATNQDVTWEELTGETADTLELTTAHMYEYVWCTVTATNSEGSATEPSNPTSLLVYSVRNTVAPVASGTPTEGETLSVTNGTWLGDPAPTFAYRWHRSFTPISGATSSTYELVADDVGEMIACRVEAENTDGFPEGEFSNEVGPIAAASGGSAQPNCYRMTAGGLVPIVARRMTSSGLFPPLS